MYVQIHSTIGLEIKFLQKSIFGYLTPQFIAITFHKEIQAMIVAYIVDHSSLKRCKKKRYEQGYDTFSLLTNLYQNNRQKLGYFNIMNYFGFIGVN